MTIEHSTTKVVLRWIAFLPAALIGSACCYFIVRTLIRFGLWIGGRDPNHLFLNLITEIIANAALGACFVYIGTLIAPTNNKPVTYILTFISIFATGLACYSPLVQNDWFAVISFIGIAAGASYTGISLANNSTKKDDLLAQ